MDNVNRITVRSPVSSANGLGNKRQPHLYVMSSDVGLIKIGRSDDPDRRRREIENASGLKIRLLLVVLDHGPSEREIHRRLHAFRKNGEWFTDTDRFRDALNHVLRVRVGYSLGAKRSRKIRARSIPPIEKPVVPPPVTPDAQAEYREAARIGRLSNEWVRNNILRFRYCKPPESWSAFIARMHPKEIVPLESAFAIHIPHDEIEAALKATQNDPELRGVAQLWADLIMDGRPPAATLLELPRRSG